MDSQLGYFKRVVKRYFLEIMQHSGMYITIDTHAELDGALEDLVEVTDLLYNRQHSTDNELQALWDQIIRLENRIEELENGQEETVAEG